MSNAFNKKTKQLISNSHFSGIDKDFFFSRHFPTYEGKGRIGPKVMTHTIPPRKAGEREGGKGVVNGASFLSLDLLPFHSHCIWFSGCAKKILALCATSASTIASNTMSDPLTSSLHFGRMPVSSADTGRTVKR